MLAARSLMRELVWYFGTVKRSGTDRDILLFATRRGGSTWAMELIGANRRVRPLNHPLEVLSRKITPAQMVELPKFDRGQITSLDESDAEVLHRFVSRLLSGEFAIGAPTRFWQRGYDYTADRVVLKITDAKAVIDWFDDNFAVDIVYLTRDPVAQAISCIRNQWTLTTRAYLRDEVFVQRYIGDNLGFCHDAMSGGSLLEQFAMNWFVENVAPLRLLTDRPAWTHIRYEDCVIDPEATLARLADRLGLHDMERMRRNVTKPSRSSRISTTQTVNDISEGRAAATLARSRGEVDTDELRRIRAMAERLEIDLDVVLPSELR